MRRKSAGKNEGSSVGVVHTFSSSIWQTQGIFNFILFFYFSSEVYKPSNAVSLELKHTFTAFTCLTTVSAEAHCTAANAKIPKQQQLSAPLCLLFTR